MTRIIHVHPRHLDFQTERSLEYLLHHLRDDFELEDFVIGSGGDCHNLASAALALRRKRVEGNIVHAWGATAFKAAVLAGSRSIVYSPDPQAAPKIDGWLRRSIQRGEIRIVCPTTSMRNMFLKRGVPPEQCDVILPSLFRSPLPVSRERDRVRGISKQKPQSNSERPSPQPSPGVPGEGEYNRTPQPIASQDLRANLGFSKDDFIVLAAGESTLTAAHRTALWAVSILHVLDVRFRLLVWGRGPQCAALVRFAKRLRQEKLIVLAEPRLNRSVDFEALTKIANAALIPALTSASILPALICRASRLPIVASQTEELSEILDHYPTSQLILNPTPKTLAQAVWAIRQQGRPAQISDTDFIVTSHQKLTYNSISQWKSIYQSYGVGRPGPINLIDISQAHSVS